MGSGKRNYRALRASSRKWKREHTSSEAEDNKEKPKIQTEEQKRAMEELTALYKKKKKDE